MRYILILFMLVGIANAQFAPTSSKTKFIAGIGLGSKDTSAFSAADTMVVTIGRDSVMYYKYKGYWRTIGGSTAGFVPYSGATDNVNLGSFKLTANKGAVDSVQAKGSGGLGLYSNGGTKVADFGGGGGSQWTNYGYAGYDANRSSGYTARSFTDKGYVDSSAGLRVRYTDTAAMLARSPLVNRFLDTATALQTRIQTKQPLLTNPITGTGTSGQVAYWNGTSTQTGSSNHFWDATNNRLGIGTNSPLYDLSIYRNSGNAIFNVRSGGGPGGTVGGRNILFFQSARGTLASPSASAVGDAIGEFVGSGYTNSAFQNVAAMNFAIDAGTVSSTSLPSFINFETTPNGSLTRTERGRINNAGRLLWNTTTDNGVDNVQVNGSLIATTLKGTTNTVSGNSTIGGTLGVTGVITGAAIRSGATNTIGWTGQGGFESVTDGNFRLYNEARTVNGNLTLGAITASSLAGTGDRVVVASSTGVLSASQIVTSGTYTPTVTNIANATGITASSAQYMRVGSVVTVSGRIQFTTTSSINTQVELTLPISSSFANINEAAGTANCPKTAIGINQVAVIQARASNTTVLLETYGSGGVSYNFYYTYTYQII